MRGRRCRCKRRLTPLDIAGIVDVLHHTIQFYDEHGQKDNSEYSYLVESALLQECHRCFRPRRGRG